jgi:hypothetical protein
LRIFLLVALAGAVRAFAGEGTLPVPIPGGQGGIGFDDLVFGPVLHRVIVPGGRTGNLDLIDPATRKITVITGFSTESRYGGGHGEGTTSADEGGRLLFATDRSTRSLAVIDPERRAIVASAKLAAGPDYVRFVQSTGEVWVTEPGAEQIEVFSIPRNGTPTPSRVGIVHVAGGPESLVIDNQRDRAYTHLWKTETVAIDLRAHSVAAQWKNGCAGSRGIALDAERALLFAGCEEGKATAMDLRRQGAVAGTAATAKGVDVIAYSPQLHHLYVPGADSATMTVLAVADDGKLSPVATVPTAKDAHCVVADDHGGAWVCDPRGGRLLLYPDTAAAQ